jgi:hypothetical protein
LIRFALRDQWLGSGVGLGVVAVALGVLDAVGDEDRVMLGVGVGAVADTLGAVGVFVAGAETDGEGLVEAAVAEGSAPAVERGAPACAI